MQVHGASTRYFNKVNKSRSDPTDLRLTSVDEVRNVLLTTQCRFRALIVKTCQCIQQAFNTQGFSLRGPLPFQVEPLELACSFLDSCSHYPVDPETWAPSSCQTPSPGWFQLRVERVSPNSKPRRHKQVIVGIETVTFSEVSHFYL